MPNDTVRISPDVKVAKIEGEYILMDLKAGIYRGLDPVASQVWESLCDHGSVTRAAEDLCRHFDVDYERASKDVTRWVEELVEHGLVLRDGRG